MNKSYRQAAVTIYSSDNLTISSHERRVHTMAYSKVISELLSIGAIRFKLQSLLACTIFIIVCLFTNSGGIINAQVTGAPLPGKPQEEDSTIIFKSPRPLISEQQQSKLNSKIWGVDVLFSTNGFGAGFFYQRNFSDLTSGFINFGVSGARNSDEFEDYDYSKNEFFIKNKVNRLYIFPLTIGVQYRIFADKIAETFRPHINAGVGSTFILAIPYERTVSFFTSLGQANTYTRFGGFLGIGADLGGSGKNSMGVNVRYYFIPFGGDGLESIRGLPITDFGGLFLTVSVGLFN
ncbi:MAG: hypothetical protein HYZ54_07565 [Ignavibacteriae bacterium]|nr:hypothetical protein [Ignavibacteriota bacterium]